ncbi:hypothetical protein ABKV19_015824 [Rosa sericea]
MEIDEEEADRLNWDFHRTAKIWGSLISELKSGLKLGNGFTAKASMVVNETNSKSLVSEKRANSPIIVIDNYDSFTYNLCQSLGNGM